MRFRLMRGQKSSGRRSNNSSKSSSRRAEIEIMHIGSDEGKKAFDTVS